jgi:hypothetical protein
MKSRSLFLFLLLILTLPAFSQKPSPFEEGYLTYVSYNLKPMHGYKIPYLDMVDIIGFEHNNNKKRNSRFLMLDVITLEDYNKYSYLTAIYLPDKTDTISVNGIKLAYDIHKHIDENNTVQITYNIDVPYKLYIINISLKSTNSTSTRKDLRHLTWFATSCLKLLNEFATANPTRE